MAPAPPNGPEAVAGGTYGHDSESSHVRIFNSTSNLLRIRNLQSNSTHMRRSAAREGFESGLLAVAENRDSAAVGSFESSSQLGPMPIRVHHGSDFQAQITR
jgi:hypothetical protein